MNSKFVCSNVYYWNKREMMLINTEKTIGETIREIRKSLGLTQEDIAEKNVISRSAIAKIEANKMNPSVELLNIILFKLRIEYREFIFIQKDYSLTEREKIIHDFKRLGNSVYKDAAMKLNGEMVNYLAANDDPEIQELHAVLRALTRFQDTQEFHESINEIKFIWDRLKNQDNWHEFDIYLLSHIFFKFEPGDVDTMVTNLLKNVDKYRDFNTNNTLKISLLLNIITYYKYHGMLLQSEKYIEEAYNLASIEKDFRRKLAAMYRQCEVDFVKGNAVQANQKAEQIFQALHTLNEKELYEDWHDEWDKLTKKGPAK